MLPTALAGFRGRGGQAAANLKEPADFWAFAGFPGGGVDNPPGPHSLPSSRLTHPFGVAGLTHLPWLRASHILAVRGVDRTVLAGFRAA
jgi:hypothetical protein